jgi:Rne/Rng family ribonuclease
VYFYKLLKSQFLPKVRGFPQISLTGRFLVLIPFDNKVSISKKIKNNQEKERLKMLIESIRPEGFGVIIRTVAEGKSSRTAQ